MAEFINDTTGSDYFALYSAGATITYQIDVFLAHQFRTERTVGKIEGEAVWFPYPPHLMLAMVPFTVLPFLQSQIIFSIIQFGLVLFGFWLVNRWRVDTWLVLLGSHMIYEGLLLGQYYGIVFFGFALLVWSQDRWPWLAGLGLLSTKPQFAIYPLIWTLVRDRLLTLAVIALVGSLVVGSFLVIGLDEVPASIETVMKVVNGNWRLFDLRTMVPFIGVFLVSWLCGLLYTFTGSRLWLMILLSVIFSPTVTIYDLSYLLVLLPMVHSRFSLSIIALFPLTTLLLRQYNVPPILMLYLALALVLLGENLEYSAVRSIKDKIKAPVLVRRSFT